MLHEYTTHRLDSSAAAWFFLRGVSETVIIFIRPPRYSKASADNCSQVVRCSLLVEEEKKKTPDAKALECKCVATIYLFIFLKPGTGLLGKRKRREGNILHKWWLIAEAFFFAHAPQINVSPVYTAHSTLSNRTVRDICHVTGWRRRLLHPSRPIGEGRNKVPQEAPGIGVTPAAPREASDFFFFPWRAKWTIRWCFFAADIHNPSFLLSRRL